MLNIPDRHAFTVAVILDCTGTYRTNDSYAYVTKLKVIDDSYNPTNNKSSKLLHYVHIFIHSQTLSAAPQGL